MTTTHRSEKLLDGKLSRAVLKAGRREQSLLPSYHVRYIEHHQLGFAKPVYVISILENFSRMILASILSEHQDQDAYLKVLFVALHRYGAPEAIVTDGGAIFYAQRAMHIYEALGIRKERITPSQPWENYIEAHLYVSWNSTKGKNCQLTCIMWTWRDHREAQFHIIGVMRRLADYHLGQAESWAAMQHAHAKFVQDYDTQVHWAHRERQDGRHSPQEVLLGVLGRTFPEQVLERILAATQFPRVLDQFGYLRFRHWRFYGEVGLAKQPVTVWTSTSTLKVEYQGNDLALYTVEWQEDSPLIKAVSHPRLIQTHYQSPQLTLFDLGPDEWLLFLRAPTSAPRKQRHVRPTMRQLPLFPEDTRRNGDAV